VRITAAVWGLKLDDMTKAGLKVGSGDDMVRTEFVKWVADGSNQGLTGYMREPYLNSESRGVANYTVDELVANFTASLEAGRPVTRAEAQPLLLARLGERFNRSWETLPA
jgi:predicted amidohydrolase YtcJ